ncbi:PLATZ transcription factor - like 10 [Theobroma cacao]|uniref:PLATZ transcription factor family protein n=1 Tax=Theobroma cacao TaxID=3641 RepID=A0A061EY69_THECC|nr:Uncharacterized protein TCM_025112 [Theobroma cacao]WRX25333.1 PLATZ transcription factor - like 10 [Theobroma cacao]
MENLLELSWLMALQQQKSKFYEPCDHCQSSRTSTYFCKDCMMAFVFCERCKNRSSDHGNHDYFQVFKPSYRLGVRVHDMQGLFDVSDIKNHTHNRHTVVYVDLKDQCACRRAGGSVTRYCSIQCKVDDEAALCVQSAYDQFAEAAAVRARHRKGAPHRSPFY